MELVAGPGSGSKDVVVHECTSAFLQWVFDEFLGEEYQVHKFVAPEHLKRNTVGTSLPFRVDPWLLSQNMFGWPALRPRQLGVV